MMNSNNMLSDRNIFRSKLIQSVLRSSLVMAMMVFAANVTAGSEQELRQTLTKYNGFTADFDQQVVDSSNNVLHQAQGLLKFEQPGRFVWQISEPEPELLVSDGVTLWWHNPFIEQVSLFDSADAVSQTPFALLVSQDDEIWAQFDIEKTESGFTIRPKLLDQAQVIELNVQFNEALLSTIEVVGRTMQTSLYQLSKQTFTDVDDSVFKFEIPAGTDVDDQRKLPEINDGNVKY